MKSGRELLQKNPHKDTALGNLVVATIREDVGGSPLIAIEANGYIIHRIHKGMIVGNDVIQAVS